MEENNEAPQQQDAAPADNTTVQEGTPSDTPQTPTDPGSTSEGGTATTDPPPAADDGGGSAEQLAAINKKMDDILNLMNAKTEPMSTEVYLRNGDSFTFFNKVTLGESLIAVSILLLLTFQVIKWLLSLAWKGRE